MITNSISHRFVYFILVCLYLNSVGAISCFHKSICEGNNNNGKPFCSKSKPLCERGYGGIRNGFSPGSMQFGIDVKCQPGNDVFMPIKGSVMSMKPLHNDGCMDHGIQIDGLYEYLGYRVQILFAELTFNFDGSRHPAKSEKIGVSTGTKCGGDAWDDRDDFIMIKFFKNNVPTDPSSMLDSLRCQCTGIICEGSGNQIIDAYKNRGDFGNSLELKCDDIQRYDKTELPKILSPIDADKAQWVRLWEVDSVAQAGDSADKACKNNAIYLEATDGAWSKYTVNIYNAKLRPDIIGYRGGLQIKVGDEIGVRLDCEGSPQSVFVEFRKNGVPMNLTEQVMGTQCTVENNFHYFNRRPMSQGGSW